jgi:hypothetical protein
LGLAAAVSAVTFAGERPAAACGGCFHPPTQTVTDITDERMLLSVSATQSTLYDQIQYSGSPSSFAWVLPIHGTVTVGLSADILFDSIDELTATKIIAPPRNCPPPPSCGVGGSRGGGYAAADASAAPVVTVTAQANVGPYATVQLHSTDSTALDNWLTQNGYDIPATIQPILDAYVQEGFDFLAMKLLPNQGVQAMRPVRVTTAGASLSLPLRMASVGTGPITGITIWVVADGRYEPQNFPFFHIDDSQLVWDWSISLSNYTTLRVQNEANLKNAGWEIESSIALNEQLVTSVILSGGRYYGGGLGGASAPVSASQDYLPVGDPDAGGDAGETAEQVRDDDIGALFAGLTGPTVRFTRIRSDIAQRAMTADLALQASSDQSELSNVRNVTQSVNLVCPVYPACPVTDAGTTGQGKGGVSDASVAIDATVGGGTSGSSGGPSGPGGSSSAGGGTGGNQGANGGSSSGSSPGSGAAAGSGGAGMVGGRGCAAAAQSTTDAGVGFAATAGALGLVIGRAIRVRRRRARSEGRAGGSASRSARGV